MENSFAAVWSGTVFLIALLSEVALISKYYCAKNAEGYFGPAIPLSFVELMPFMKILLPLKFALSCAC